MSGGTGPADGVVPGEVIPGDGAVELFAGAALVEITVTNTGDRAVQVGSHYHLAEANTALAFDRAAARGHRLAIPAGTSVRFEPGIERRVELVPLGGRRVVAGLRGEVAGPLDAGSSPHTDFLRGSGRSSDQIRGENPGGG